MRDIMPNFGVKKICLIILYSFEWPKIKGDNVAVHS